MHHFVVQSMQLELDRGCMKLGIGEMEEKNMQGNKTFIFRTEKYIRNDVAMLAAKRLLDGYATTGVGPAYSANQVYVEAACKALGIEYSPKQRVEDEREKVGISLIFPMAVHQALMNRSYETGKSMNELMNDWIRDLLDEEQAKSSNKETQASI